MIDYMVAVGTIELLTIASSFFVRCSFRNQTIMALHSFVFFVDLSNIYLYVSSSNCNYLLKLTSYVTHCFLLSYNMSFEC